MRLPLVCLCVLLVCLPAFSQEPSPAAVVVPRLIRFSDQVKDAAGTVGITFTLHKTQDDNVPLWIETQNVAVDTGGHYTVLLGATKIEGIPTELFTSGEAQWLSVRVEGKAEQARVLLVSVPYAMKAAEAETLAGHAASDFVTTDEVTTLVKRQLQSGGVTPSGHDSKSTTTSTAATAGPTKFSGNTTDNIVAATQTGAGTAVTAIAPGTAVYGTSTNTSGNAYGVRGTAASANGVGVLGSNSSTTGIAIGLEGTSSSSSGTALYGVESATSGNTKGIVAAVASSSGTALVVQNTGGGMLISGQSGSSHTQVFGVDDAGDISMPGGVIDAMQISSQTIQAVAPNNLAAIYGENDANATLAIAMQGRALYGIGGEFIGAALTPNYGVLGFSGHSDLNDFPSNLSVSGGLFGGPNGVLGATDTKDGSSGWAVAGIGNDSGGSGVTGGNYGSAGYGVYGYDLIGNGSTYAGYFSGKVLATGGVSTAAVKVIGDHPLDAANKTLSHVAVASPEMKNMYDGVVTTDASGEAVVHLPTYFEAYNRDFRYQLTSLGQFAQAIVVHEIENNQFTIKTDKPNVRVSWQVTGVRNDAYAKGHPVEVETDKPEGQRGLYLHPEENGVARKLNLGEQRLREHEAEAARAKEIAKSQTLKK